MTFGNVNEHLTFIYTSVQMVCWYVIACLLNIPFLHLCMLFGLLSLFLSLSLPLKTKIWLEKCDLKWQWTKELLLGKHATILLYQTIQTNAEKKKKTQPYVVVVMWKVHFCFPLPWSVLRRVMPCCITKNTSHSPDIRWVRCSVFGYFLEKIRLWQ